MISGTVTRDDKRWQGHPDVAYFNDTLFIVFRQSDSHMTRNNTSIQIVSKQKNQSFTQPSEVFSSTDRLNCPRLSVIDDTIWIACDIVERSPNYIKAENDENQTKVLMWKSTDGFHWDGPIVSNVTGIVPDRICKTDDGYLMATHTSARDKNFLGFDKARRLVQNVWHTEDLEGDWTQHSLCDDKKYNLCEASIVKMKNGFLCLMRENSGQGLPALASFSKNGTVWEDCFETRMFGCHRPVSGILNSGNLLTTYREASHSFLRGYWAKNTFACLTSRHSVSRTDKLGVSIILPLDHDNSKSSDSGYTGWVQLPDDSIFIVNYITGKAPLPYIRWYQILESDF